MTHPFLHSLHLVSIPDCTVLQSPVRSWKYEILETVCIANKVVKHAIEHWKALERKQRTDFAKFWKSVARGCFQQADGTIIVALFIQ